MLKFTVRLISRKIITYQVIIKVLLAIRQIFFIFESTYRLGRIFFNNKFCISSVFYSLQILRNQIHFKSIFLKI